MFTTGLSGAVVSFIGLTRYAAAILSVDLSGYVIVRLPFSSTLYCVPAGRLGLAVLTESMILFFSSPLTLFGFAISTFVPATGSYFLVVSRTVTTICRSIVAVSLLVGSGLPITLKVIVLSPRGWFHATVPSALASLFVTFEPRLSSNPPDGFTPATLKAVSLVIPK